MIKKIQQAKIAAMKSGKKGDNIVLSGVVSEFKNKAIEKRVSVEDLTEAEGIQIIKKLISQREASILAFEKAKRLDLVDIEKWELTILSEFLPKMMNDVESAEMAVDAIKKLEAKTQKDDMKRVMLWIKDNSGGRINMKIASQVVKQNLD